MCDDEVIAAILENLGYLDEKKKEETKDNVQEEGSKDDSKNSGEERK